MHVQQSQFATLMTLLLAKFVAIGRIRIYTPCVRAGDVTQQV